MKTKKEKQLKNLEKVVEMSKGELISTYGGAYEYKFIDGKWVLVKV